MTPMQEFALSTLKNRGAQGTCGAHVGAMWTERNGGRRSASSRRSFGATSAGYRALRALVSAGLAIRETRKTSGGYTIETYYPA